MKTYQDYVNGEISHEDFYSQIVTDGIKLFVKAVFGKEIKKSTDEHFNDIPLSRWDGATQLLQTATMTDRIKSFGCPVSLSTRVCVLKQAAREVKKEL